MMAMLPAQPGEADVKVVLDITVQKTGWFMFVKNDIGGVIDSPAVLFRTSR
jgi:hypothetical protein